MWVSAFMCLLLIQGVGAKLNHLLCSHCCDSSEIYTLLANYPSVLRTERNHTPLSATFFPLSVKQLLSLVIFFSFSLCNICFLLQFFFFLYLRVISCFIWLFLPNALSKCLLCPSRYAITRYGLGWLYFFAVKSNIQFSNFISALNYVTWNEC